MSLARRPRGTEDADVDETPEPQLEAEPVPAPAPAPAPADPEPLGAHAPGSDAARAAFIADAPAPPPSAADSKPKDGASRPASEAVPAVTWADMSRQIAQLVDLTGQLGGRYMKRPDVPWALTEEEKAAVAATSEPVMRQYFGGNEVTPLAALLMTLAGLYGPRLMFALATKPDAPPRAPAPPPPAPAPAPPEKLPTLQRVDGKSPEW